MPGVGGYRATEKSPKEDEDQSYSKKVPQSGVRATSVLGDFVTTRGDAIRTKVTLVRRRTPQ